MAVADDQAVAGLVAVILVGADVLGHLVFDGLLQGPAGALAGDLLQGDGSDRLGCQPQDKR